MTSLSHEKDNCCEERSVVLETGVGHLTSQTSTCEEQKGVGLSGVCSVPSVGALELELKEPACLHSSLVPGEKNRRFQPAEQLSLSLSQTSNWTSNHLNSHRDATRRDRAH